MKVEKPLAGTRGGIGGQSQKNTGSRISRKNSSVCVYLLSLVPCLNPLEFQRDRFLERSCIIKTCPDSDFLAEKPMLPRKFCDWRDYDLPMHVSRICTVLLGRSFLRSTGFNGMFSVSVSGPSNPNSN